MLKLRKIKGRGKMKILSGFLSGLLILFAWSIACPAEPQTGITPQKSEEAIELAEKSSQYLFLIFYGKEDELLKEMQESVSAFMKKSSVKTTLYQALISNEKEAAMAAKYRLVSQQMPFLLVFAPNGAITGGFPQKVDAVQLSQCCPLSELVLKVIKPLQNGKLVLVSLQNEKTKFNKEAGAAIADFSKIPALAGKVDNIGANPAADKNTDFIKQCKLNGNISEATVVMLVPPGVIAGIISGDKITKDNLLSVLTSCISGSSGCSSGGSGAGGSCCPK